MDITRTLEIENVSSGSSNPLVELGVTLSKPAITPERTAQLLLFVENGTDSPISISTFPKVIVPNGDGGIALERSERTPRPECPNDAEYIEFPAVAEAPVQIEPGETVERPYFVFDDPTDERCYPVGTYPFAVEFDRRDADDPTESYTISFAVEVSQS